MACSLDSEFMHKWFAGHTPRSAFVRDVSRALWALHDTGHILYTGPPTHEKGEWGGFLIPDPLAACLAVQPSLITSESVRGVVVELSGAHTRGQTCVDWGGVHTALAPPCVHIVHAVDLPALRRLLLDSVEAGE